MKQFFKNVTGLTIIVVGAFLLYFGLQALADLLFYLIEKAPLLANIALAVSCILGIAAYMTWCRP